MLAQVRFWCYFADLPFLQFLFTFSNFSLHFDNKYYCPLHLGCLIDNTAKYQPILVIVYKLMTISVFFLSTVQTDTIMA